MGGWESDGIRCVTMTSDKFTSSANEWHYSMVHIKSTQDPLGNIKYTVNQNFSSDTLYLNFARSLFKNGECVSYVSRYLEKYVYIFFKMENI